MSVWAGLLIVAVAGMIALLVRRLPAAVSDVRQGITTPPAPQSLPPGDKSARRWQPGLILQRFLSWRRLKPRQSVLRTTQSVPQAEPLPEPGLTTASQPLPVEAVEELPLAAAQPLAKSVDRPTLITEGAAEAAYHERQFDEAALIYENLIRQQPHNEHFYSRLGLVYLELERFHDARDVFRTDLKFGDQVASRHFNLAMAEYGLGHRLTAVRYLKRAITLAPQTKKYRTLLATFESERG